MRPAGGSSRRCRCRSRRGRDWPQPPRRSRRTSRPATSFVCEPLRRHGETTGPKQRCLVRGAHGEFVIVELAEHHGAVAPEVGADRRIHRSARNCPRICEQAVVRTSLRREQVLDAERQCRRADRPRRAARRASAAAAIAAPVRRFQHIGIERARRLDRRQMRRRSVQPPKSPACGAGRAPARASAR